MMAPGVSRVADLACDPQAMDAIREGLRRLGVQDCVAFVIGATAERHPGPLERWLESGYELGNHTHHHAPATEAGCGDFLASVDQCDRLLARLGAFSGGRRKWFRFPLLDYGADGAAARQLRRALCERGYRIAHASTDLYDHAYEGALGRALAAGNRRLEELVDRRFRRAALFSVAQSAQLVARHFGPEAPLVLYAHFGRVSGRGLVPVLEHLAGKGATWCSLERALQSDLYRRLDDDHRYATGLATSGLRRQLAWRIGRRLMRLAGPVGDLWARRAGPRFPALTGG